MSSGLTKAKLPLDISKPNSNSEIKSNKLFLQTVQLKCSFYSIIPPDVCFVETNIIRPPQLIPRKLISVPAANERAFKKMFLTFQNKLKLFGQPPGIASQLCANVHAQQNSFDS